MVDGWMDKTKLEGTSVPKGNLFGHFCIDFICFPGIG
jgi:hypothetical protein